MRVSAENLWVGVKLARHAHHQCVQQQGRKESFWDPKGEEKLSKMGWSFVDRSFHTETTIGLLLNPSVNAYRAGSAFEAPNQIRIGGGSRFYDSDFRAATRKSIGWKVVAVSAGRDPYMVMLSISRPEFTGDTGEK